MKITIYTDGSSRGNPGPGGWAAILITEHKTIDDRGQSTETPEYQDEVIELGGSEDHTTNNRMELIGTIKGLKEIPVSSKRLAVSSNTNSDPLHTAHCTLVTEVEICTDSQYVKKGITEWIDGWIAKGWKTSTKKQVLNQDLWEELHKEERRLKDAGVKVVWTYVPGHAGVPLNERADVIATSCADSVIIQKGLPAASAAQAGATNLQLYRGPKREYPLGDSL